MNFVNDEAEVDAVLAMINATGATVLMVGLGAPKQEIWIAQVRHRLPGVKVMMGIGATIDYEAGEVKRAPEWVRRVGLEWAHRVVTEPARYLSRYARNSVFFWWVLQEKLGRYRDPFAA
jgi:exopolysaccharide biosynthesis WecB/TagA/CpsF family protein